MHPNAKLGEDLVVNHLIRHGFKIMKRNFYWCRHEIDIIASRNTIIYIFEVKYISNIHMFQPRTKQLQAYDQFIRTHYEHETVKVYFAIINNNKIQFISMESIY